MILYQFELDQVLNQTVNYFIFKARGREEKRVEKWFLYELTLLQIMCIKRSSHVSVSFPNGNTLPTAVGTCTSPALRWSDVDGLRAAGPVFLNLEQ